MWCALLLHTSMALWEYKVITSGLHGFASPALLEAHLNALGKDEWEIVHFQTQPNNPLAFNGLVRRSTVRDWTPPEPVVAPAKPAVAAESVEAVKTAPVAARQEAAVASSESEDATVKPVREETIRKVRDTERDQDPEAEEEDDWDEWADEEDDLPTFFEAIKPHLRRNQRGPGMSVAVDYLAKRWEQRESDVLGALKECGFTIPETEEADPDYFEFEGDLYWINRNNRGQLFVNTREKPRPVFRTVPVTKLAADDPTAAELVAERAAEKAEIEKRNQERAERQAAQQAAAQARAEARAAAQAAQAAQAAAQAESAAAAPQTEANPEIAQPAPAGGEALLDRIRPLMRRNRRGPGYSGSVTFLARALHLAEADLIAALEAMGLAAPANPADKPTSVDIGRASYWVNKDGRGGIWINGRERRDNGGKPEAAVAPASEAAGSDSGAPSAENAEGTAASGAPTGGEVPAEAPTGHEGSAVVSSDPGLETPPEAAKTESDSEAAKPASEDSASAAEAEPTNETTLEGQATEAPFAEETAVNGDGAGEPVRAPKAKRPARPRPKKAKPETSNPEEGPSETSPSSS